jgi:hypothetical protein
MIASARRIFSLLTLGFAVMGFVAVPIFDKPALKHVSDFLARPDVKEAEAKARKDLEDWGRKFEDGQETSEDAVHGPEEPTPLSRREQRRSDNLTESATPSSKL